MGQGKPCDESARKSNLNRLLNHFCRVDDYSVELLLEELPEDTPFKCQDNVSQPMVCSDAQSCMTPRGLQGGLQGNAKKLHT